MSTLLLAKGYEVVHLGRKPGVAPGNIPVFAWDYTRDYLDSRALEGVHFIVHLAGAGVADGRWTDRRKQEIIDSRVKTAGLLYQALEKDRREVQAIISASAVGWYGDGGDGWQSETDQPGKGFLSETCVLWEEAISRFAQLGIRECRMRIGVILSPDGGALPQMARPVQLGIGAFPGNGRQYMPWIHLDDVCGIFIKAIEDSSMSGPYNTAAPEPVTARDFTAAIAGALGKPFLPLPGPAIALRLAMGEMADIVLFSNRVSAARVIGAGYAFRFVHLPEALHDIYGK